MMENSGKHPYGGWARQPAGDVHSARTLAAWRTAQAHLTAHGQPDGMAALLLPDADAAPGSAATQPLIEQARRRLPPLLSSTRKADISGAVAAALPLIGAGPGLTPSWDDFLMGYLCGLRASPLLDARRILFLRAFGEAMATASVLSTAASQAGIARTVQGGSPPWIAAVLDAIASGRAARCASHAERAMRIGHTSGTDALFGALLGSALWRAYPDEASLTDGFCGRATRPSLPNGVMSWQ